MKNKGVDPYNLSPSSPLKVAKFNRKNLVPYQSMNKKTYFKTLEHIIQNSNNKTHIKFENSLLTPALQNRNANLTEIINKGWKKPLLAKKEETVKERSVIVKDIDNSHLL